MRKCDGLSRDLTAVAEAAAAAAADTQQRFVPRHTAANSKIDIAKFILDGYSSLVNDTLLVL